MAYTIKFTANGDVTLAAEKTALAKKITAALTAAGLAPIVTVNKTVDFNKPKRELSPKQKEALEKRNKAAQKAAQKIVKK